MADWNQVLFLQVLGSFCRAFWVELKVEIDLNGVDARHLIPCLTAIEYALVVWNNQPNVSPSFLLSKTQFDKEFWRWFVFKV
jgi:hypothetical protein